MGYSTKIYFRKDAIRQNGTCAIYLQVIIDRKKKLIPLQLYWPADFCQDNQSLCLPRKKDDPDVDDYNLILKDSLAKATEIFKLFRLARREFDMNLFLKEWNNEYSRDSFLEYYERKLKFRLKTGDIGWLTYKNHNSTLNWLKRFKKDVKFMDFNEEWAYTFDAFLAKKIKTRDGDTHNSRWGYHKNIKAMLKLARKHEKFNFTNPYEYFETQPKRGTWGAMDQNDIEKLLEYYYHTNHLSERKVLRRFFFSVATSLRISDLMRCDRSWKEHDVLRFMAKKGERKKPKLTEIPLSKFALSLWEEAERECPGKSKLFDEVCEQYSNRILRRIGQSLEIKTRLHHHVGRHSWTTNFLNNGGSLRVAQRILNHYSITTTMKYDHLEFDQVKREVDKMEFIKTPGSA